MSQIIVSLNKLEVEYLLKDFYLIKLGKTPVSIDWTYTAESEIDSCLITMDDTILSGSGSV